MRHTQILVRAEVRAPLLTEARATEFLCLAVEAAGMNIISGPHAVLGVIPGNEGVSATAEGVSATAVLDYSSTSLHEWPNHKPHALVQFDLYTCGDRPLIWKFRNLFDQLDPVHFNAVVIDRDELLIGGLGWPTKAILSAA